MTPSAYRAGGQRVEITCVTVETHLGLLMIGATDRGLCFVQFGESEEELAAVLRGEYPAAEFARVTDPWPERLRAWVQALQDHLAGSRVALDMPLEIRATAFQMRVWRYLQSIPRGEVRSYSQVARAIGQPSAARAVANACASNCLALVIPCHRVIRATGQPGGYRWGIARKQALMESERKG